MARKSNECEQCLRILHVNWSPRTSAMHTYSIAGAFAPTKFKSFLCSSLELLQRNDRVR